MHNQRLILLGCKKPNPHIPPVTRAELIWSAPILVQQQTYPHKIGWFPNNQRAWVEDQAWVEADAEKRTTQFGPVATYSTQSGLDSTSGSAADTEMYMMGWLVANDLRFWVSNQPQYRLQPGFEQYGYRLTLKFRMGYKYNTGTAADPSNHQATIDGAPAWQLMGEYDLVRIYRSDTNGTLLRVIANQTVGNMLQVKLEVHDAAGAVHETDSVQVPMPYNGLVRQYVTAEVEHYGDSVNLNLYDDAGDLLEILSIPSLTPYDDGGKAEILLFNRGAAAFTERNVSVKHVKIEDIF